MKLTHITAQNYLGARAVDLPVTAPVLLVAGKNGAGKSSIGGHLLTRAGLAWFNPDAFAREWLATGMTDQTEANAVAWNEGMRRLDEAIAACIDKVKVRDPKHGSTRVREALDALVRHGYLVHSDGLFNLSQ